MSKNNSGKDKDGWRVYCISLDRTSSTKYILSAIDIDNLKYRR